MTGVLAVARVEAAKLGAQWRLRAAVLLAIAAPPVATAVLQLQAGLPTDTLLGRWVHEIGLSVPLVLLGSAGLFGLPVVAALVGGESLAAEHGLGTWGLLLTRGRTAGQVVGGKAVVAAGATVLLTLLLAASSVLSGVVLVGAQPLVGLSGQTIPTATSLGLVTAAWLSTLPTSLAFTATALLVGAATRSSVAGVAGPVALGLVLYVVSLVSALGSVRPLLLVPGYEAWHGLLLASPTATPVLVSTAVGLGWTSACAAALALVVRSRDLAVP